MKKAELILIDDRSRVAQCRRRAKLLANGLGYSEVDREHLSIVVTEAVSNVVRHAGRGYCLLLERHWDEQPCVEMIVWDQGPGISDLAQCLQDGFSTADSQGTGLGAMKRLSDDFEVYNPPKGGLVVVSRVRDGSQRRAAQREGSSCSVFGVSIPKPSERECGDAWAVTRASGMIKAFVVDGLGHGGKAAAASAAAVERFMARAEDPGDVLLEGIHEALRGGRGAVGAIAEIDPRAGTLRYTGIGNISGKLLRPNSSAQLISHNGTLGQQLRRVQSFEHQWTTGDTLLMHSDGMSQRWALDAFPGLLFRSPSLIGGTLMSRQCRMLDDCTVLCMKLERETAA